MPTMLSFTCPELAMTYEAIYAELAGYLEITPHQAASGFAPDDAVARVRYHRRQAGRRGVQSELARALGIDEGVVYAAVGEEGARLLLEAMQAPRWSITTRRAAPEGAHPAEAESAAV